MSFCSRVKPLDELALHVPSHTLMEEHVYNKLLVCANTLHLISCVPHSRFLDQWSQDMPLRCLGIRTAPHYTDGEKFWALLRQMKTYSDGRFTDSNFCFVVSLESGVFSWDTEPVDINLAAFAGKLIPYVRDFKPKGVRVLDQNYQVMLE